VSEREGEKEKKRVKDIKKKGTERKRDREGGG
jgi:hypothetical protein